MFNNPNFFQYPGFQARPQLFSALRKINFSQILNGTQKTLNVINQAIPIFHQVKPLWNNTKTIFKIANAINEPAPVRKSQSRNINTTPNQTITPKRNISYNEPTFFL